MLAPAQVALAAELGIVWARYMDSAALLKEIDRLLAAAANPKPGLGVDGIAAEITEFLRSFSGPKTAFYQSAAAVPARGTPDFRRHTLVSLLHGFRSYVEAGLHAQVSPQRKAQIDVVSDILAQAQRVLEDPKLHPAAAAVLIGATLEEFLRGWTDSEGLSIGTARPGIDAYAKALLGSSLIDKQDMKDLTSWAGNRNDAAHGNWAQVSDPARIRLMLDGVNLFMRKHGA